MAFLQTRWPVTAGRGWREGQGLALEIRFPMNEPGVRKWDSATHQGTGAVVTLQKPVLRTPSQTCTGPAQQLFPPIWPRSQPGLLAVGPGQGVIPECPVLSHFPPAGLCAPLQQRQSLVPPDGLGPCLQHTPCHLRPRACVETPLPLDRESLSSPSWST